MASSGLALQLQQRALASGARGVQARLSWKGQLMGVNFYYDISGLLCAMHASMIRVWAQTLKIPKGQFYL